MWNNLTIRSGSSFLGSLMSAGEEVTYIYEPLFKVTIRGIKIENLEDMEIVRKYLTNLFQCEISYEERIKEHKVYEERIKEHKV